MNYTELTPEEYQQYLLLRRRISSQGAKKRWSTQTPEQRKEVGRMLAESRIAKRKAQGE